MNAEVFVAETSDESRLVEFADHNTDLSQSQLLSLLSAPQSPMLGKDVAGWDFNWSGRHPP